MGWVGSSKIRELLKTENVMLMCPFKRIGKEYVACRTEQNTILQACATYHTALEKKEGIKVWEGNWSSMSFIMDQKYY